MKIGDKIRQLRKQQNMTLNELAEKSRVALATLSRIENNKMTGTIESHVGIARALGVALGELYSDVIVEEKKAEMQSHALPADTFVHTNKASFRILTSKVLSKKMMPIMLSIASKGQTNKEESRKGTEKFLYILEGRLEAIIGNEKFLLKSKDTLYFDGSLPHFFRNVGKVPVQAICVLCPPAL